MILFFLLIWTHSLRLYRQEAGEDVLKAHRKRNRAQKPPKAQDLKRVASRQSVNRRLYSKTTYKGSDDSDGRSENESSGSETDCQATSQKSKKKKSPDDGENLNFYSDDWKAVLTEAQQRWQLHLVIGRSTPFPERGHDLHEAHDILTEVISEHLNDGQLLDDSK